MTLEDLEKALIGRAPEGEAENKRWRAAVARLMAAAAAPESFEELASRLPPKPNYIGPGPWLDAIADAHRG